MNDGDSPIVFVGQRRRRQCEVWLEVGLVRVRRGRGRGRRRRRGLVGRQRQRALQRARRRRRPHAVLAPVTRLTYVYYS